ADDRGEGDERRERQTRGEGSGKAHQPEEEKGRPRDERDVEAGDRQHVIDARAAEVRQQGWRQLPALSDKKALEQGTGDGLQMGHDDAGDPDPDPEPPRDGEGREALDAAAAGGREVTRGSRAADARLRAGIPERLQHTNLADDANVVAGGEKLGGSVERQRGRAGPGAPGGHARPPGTRGKTGARGPRPPAAPHRPPPPP